MAELEPLLAAAAAVPPAAADRAGLVAAGLAAGGGPAWGAFFVFPVLNLETSKNSMGFFAARAVGAAPSYMCASTHSGLQR